MNFSSTTSEEQIAALIDETRQTKNGNDILLNILSRNHEIYKDRGITQVNRIRGYVLSSFEFTNTPIQAIPHICEELDNGHSPYVVAAAAIAIRSIKDPGSDLADFLSRGLIRFAHKDEAISFSSYKPAWPLQDYTTASLEILKSLAWLGANAKTALPVLENYCHGSFAQLSGENKKQALQTIEAIKNCDKKINENCCSFPRNTSSKLDRSAVYKTMLQDQDGEQHNFKGFFTGSISVAAFFYTRCDNPYKCAATVNKLAQLQAKLKEERTKDIHIAAITYDSAYDTAEQIRQYTANRGLQFNRHCKAFRLDKEDASILKNYFDLAVNYNNAIVNHHSIELFILNTRGKIIHTFAGFELNVDTILNAVKKAQKKSTGIWYKISTIFSNTVFPFLLLFFPKCPVCWAGYLSLFGLSGIPWLQYNKNYFWLLVLFICINLLFMYRHASKTNFYFPFMLAIFSYILFFVSLKLDAPTPWKWISIALIAIASLLSVLRLSLKHGLTKFNLFRIQTSSE